MVNASKPLPDDLGTVFTRAAALASGVTDRRLRAHDLARPCHGVRRLDISAARFQLESDADGGRRGPPEAELWREKHLQAANDYLAVMRDHQFFSGWTAAVIWQLPIPFCWVRTIDQIEISTFAPRTPPRGAGVRGTQLRAHLVGTCRYQGKYLLRPASVWATLGPRLVLSDRVALGDAIIRTPRHPGNFRKPKGVRLGDFEELKLLANGRGRPGRRLLLEALPLLRDGSASAPESHLRLALADAGLPEPDLDFDVYDSCGQFLGCSEFAYPEFKLALEY